MRIVICDTGPVLHLHEAAALDLLKHAGEVIIPRAVEAELKQRVPDWRRLKPRWLLVRTIAAAQRRAPADWLLTDDAEARVVAQLVGLEVHGSLGVILWAAASGHLSESDAYAALGRVAQSSLWMSQRIFAEATDALRKLFS